MNVHHVLMSLPVYSKGHGGLARENREERKTECLIDKTGGRVMFGTSQDLYAILYPHLHTRVHFALH